MLDLLLTGPFVPFTFALALLAGLLALEIVLALVGGTLLGLGADADLDADFARGFEGGFDAPGAEIDGADAGGPAAPQGPAAWLGLHDAPAMIWLAAALLGFGVSGLAIQALAEAVARPLPGPLAALPALALGLAFARGFGRVLARLIPRTETSAQSARQLARRTGVVTQGTAARGRPAEVRVTDRHGNVHFLRAEPLRDDVVIPQGVEVVVLKAPSEAGYRLVPLAD